VTAGPWRTRGELLTARATARPVAERRLLSPLRLAGAACLVAGAMFVALVATVPAGGGTAVLVAVCAVVGSALLGIAARQALRTRALITEVLAWDEAERRHRDLPASDLPPELRTPFDARADEDFEQVASLAGAQAYTRPWRALLLLRSAVAGVGGAVGLALVLIVLVNEDQPRAEEVGYGIAGVVGLLASGLLAGGAMRLGWRWTRLSSAVTAEVHELRSTRLGPVEAAGIARTESRSRALALAPIALVVVAFGAFRFSHASDTGRLVGGVVVLGVLLLVAAVALVRRSLRTSAR
jgi:hypothetical protein